MNEKRIPIGVGGTPQDDRIIILPGGNVSLTEAAEKIFARIADVRGLFFRGGRVNEIVRNPDGTCRLDPLKPSQFRSRLEEYGQVCVWRVGENGAPVLKPTICPQETAEALLDTHAAAELLPNIATLSACPVLAKIEDEIRALGAGWHAVGAGLFVTGGEIPPKIKLPDAVAALSELLADFDFASDGDRSRAFASLISPALRFGGWITSQLPVDIAEADSSQAGKTYRQKLVAAIFREIPNVVVQRNGGVGGMDESIGQKLIDGRPFVLLDNLRGRMDSPFLEAILTAPGKMPARVPHKGELQVDPRGINFQMTSNGVETTRDLANRASLIRIRKRPAGYSFRQYPEGDVFAHVVANQPYYLGCVFAVVSEWAQNGQSRTNETRHDFREWAQTLDWIVQHVFDAGPLLDGHDDARQRVSDPRRVWIRALCIALRDARRMGEEEHHATQLAEFALENDLLPPGVRSDADESVVARKIGSAMKALFGEADEVALDGFKILRIRGTSKSTGNPSIAYQFAAPA